MKGTFTNPAFSVSHLDDQELDALMKLINEEREKRKSDACNQAIEIFHNAFSQLRQIGVQIEICTEEGYFYVEKWSDFSFKF